MSDFRAQYPYWRQLLAQDWDRWQEQVHSARGPRILMATGIGGIPIFATMESLMAAALTTRGARVSFLLCNGVLPACVQAHANTLSPEDLVKNGPTNLCQHCFNPGQAVFSEMGLPLVLLGDFLSDGDRAQALEISQQVPVSDIASYRRDGVNIGEYTMAQTLRFFMRADLHGEPLAETILRRYLNAAILTQLATSQLLKQQEIDTVMVAHGMYIPDGVILGTAEKAGLWGINWKCGDRSATLALAHHKPVHIDLLDEPMDRWENLEWNPNLDKIVKDYVASRSHGHGWIYYGHDNPERRLEVVGARLGLDFSKPVIGMPTTVSWDARLLYPGTAFEDVLQWSIATIEYFRNRPDLQLLIRVHPGEVRNNLPTRQPLFPELQKHIPNMPSNVFIIPPESPVDSYAVLSACNAILFYGSTMGLELACLGLPVICCAGVVHLRYKGFTWDAETPEQYFAFLDQLPRKRQPEDEERAERARQYAFHYFYRRAIPVSVLKPGKMYHCDIELARGLDSLAPGGDPGLELICHGILNHSEFIYRYEETLTQV